MTNILEGNTAMQTSKVFLAIPADSTYLSLLRTTTASLMAKMQFTLEEIEDVRIAISEAGTLALEKATPNSELTLNFTFSANMFTVVLKCTLAKEGLPAEDGFAWIVLTTLLDGATAKNDKDTLVFSLNKAKAA